VMSLVRHLLALVRALAADRARLALENVVLRQQLNVLRRNAKRPKLEDSDRVFWLLVRGLLKDWKEHLVIVRPETVLRWHRRGFRYYWRWKSRARPGRPPIDPKLIHLIRRMSTDNPLWGAPRIRDELALLGHKVAASTVARYMVHTKDRREPARPCDDCLPLMFGNLRECRRPFDALAVPALEIAQRLGCKPEHRLARAGGFDPSPAQSLVAPAANRLGRYLQTPGKLIDRLIRRLLGQFLRDRLAQSIDQTAKVGPYRLADHQRLVRAGIASILRGPLDQVIQRRVHRRVDLIVQFLGAFDLLDALVRRSEEQLPGQVRQFAALEGGQLGHGHALSGDTT